MNLISAFDIEIDLNKKGLFKIKIYGKDCNAMENEIILNENEVRSKIYTIRNLQVILDKDLAELYGVETKALNQAVKRNSERFVFREKYHI